MDDLTRELIAGTAAPLEEARREVAAFARGEGDASVLARTARLMHTIKGTAGFIGLTRLEALARAVERAGGAVSLTRLEEALARISSMMEHLATHGSEPAGDDLALMEALGASMADAPPTPPREIVQRPHETLKVEAPVATEMQAAVTFTLPPLEVLPAAEMPMAEPLPPAAPPRTPERTRVRPPAVTTPALGGAELLRVATELVDARNQLQHVASTQEVTALAAPIRRLNALIARLKPRLDPKLIDRHAIERVLVMQAGSQAFALAESDVLELITLTPEHTVQMVGEAWLLRLRERLLPLMPLVDMLKLGTTRGPLTGTVAVMRAGGMEFGLVVASLEDAQEIVVRPLSAVVGTLPVYRGMSVLGDTRIALVLDAAGVGTIFGAEGGAYRPREAMEATPPVDYLLVRAAGSMKALPLAAVVRLEASTAEEMAAGAMEYRGARVPILTLPGSAPHGDAPVHCVMLRHEGAQLALAVEAIGDIARGVALAGRRARAPFVLGSAMLGGQPTDVLDLAALTSHTVVEAS